MIAVSCTHCGKKRLLGLNSLTGLKRNGNRLEVGFECACGHAGSMAMMTGAARA